MKITYETAGKEGGNQSSRSSPQRFEQLNPTIDDADTALFRDAVRGVAPLAQSDKVPLTTEHPRPIPRQTLDDGQTAPVDSLSDHISLEMEAGDEWAFVRPGMPRQTLRRLRRGYWRIEAQLDLHGFTRDEARRNWQRFWMPAAYGAHVACE